MAVQQAQSGKWLGVQSLRALAALGVVLFHASSRAGAPLLIGEARVDLFFVISGLALWLARERYLSPGEFLSDRFLRVVPLYWLATAGMLVGGLLHVFPNLRMTPHYVISSFLFIPAPPPGGGNLEELWPLLTQGWTMNYEIFFYLLFALVLLAPRALQLGALCGAITLLVIAGLLAHPEAPVLAFYTNSITLEFVAGLAIGVCVLRGLLLTRALAVLVTLIGVAAFLGLETLAPDAPRALARGVPAALILYGVVAMEHAGLVVSTPSLLFLGNASFSIYLFHNFGVSLAGRLIGDRLGGPAEIALCMVAGVLVGVLAHLAVERPFLRFRKALRRKRDPGTRQAAPV